MSLYILVRKIRSKLMTSEETTIQDSAVNEKTMKKFPFGKCFIICTGIVLLLLALSQPYIFGLMLGAIILSLIITGIIALIYNIVRAILKKKVVNSE